MLRPTRTPRLLGAIFLPQAEGEELSLQEEHLQEGAAAPAPPALLQAGGDTVRRGIVTQSTQKTNLLSPKQGSGVQPLRGDPHLGPGCARSYHHSHARGHRSCPGPHSGTSPPRRCPCPAPVHAVPGERPGAACGTRRGPLPPGGDTCCHTRWVACPDCRSTPQCTRR